jgi:hypothetical protein
LQVALALLLLLVWPLRARWDLQVGSCLLLLQTQAWLAA